MLELQFLNGSEKFLDKIPAKHAKQIVTRIEKLVENPHDVPSVGLIGYFPLRRIKSGEYRVIYYIEGDTVYIDAIDKRNDDAIYKRLKR